MATTEADTSDEHYSEGMYMMSLSKKGFTITQEDAFAHVRLQSQRTYWVKYH